MAPWCNVTYVHTEVHHFLATPFTAHRRPCGTAGAFWDEMVLGHIVPVLVAVFTPSLGIGAVCGVSC